MAEVSVNGRVYPLVPPDQITLDEAMVIYDYTKLSLDELPEEGFHPGLIAALLHIAVARGEPNEPARAIRKAVGQIPVASLEEVFMDLSEESGEQDPPPGAPSNGSGAASSTSGEPPPARTPAAPTGSRGSATGATSAPRTSAG